LEFLGRDAHRERLQYTAPAGAQALARARDDVDHGRDAIAAAFPPRLQ
jgi:hypothetical protein